MHEKLYKTSSQIILPFHYKPRGCDVLCGRGKHYRSHKGNMDFQNMIDTNLEKYTKFHRKVDKTRMVVALVTTFRQLGTLFVKYDRKTKRWNDIGDQRVRHKIAHSFRDTIAAINRNKEKAAEKQNCPTANKITSIGIQSINDLSPIPSLTDLSIARLDEKQKPIEIAFETVFGSENNLFSPLTDDHEIDDSLDFVDYDEIIGFLNEMQEELRVVSTASWHCL